MKAHEISAVAALMVLVALGTHAESGCEQLAQSSLSAEIIEDREGYLVQLSESPSYRTTLPERAMYVFGPAESLSSPPNNFVYFLDAQNRASLDFEDQWRGRTLTEAVRTFLDSAGLAVVQAEIGGWVVGRKEKMDRQAVNVVAYQFEQRKPRQTTASPAEIGRALFSNRRARYWSESYGSLEIVGIGYMPIEDSETDWLVVYSQRSDDGDLDGLIARVRVDHGWRNEIECLWSIPYLAEPVTTFSEDVNGDGVGDFLFLTAWDNYHDFVISGSDGQFLAKFNSETVAVGRDSERVLVAARSKWMDKSNLPYLFGGSGVDGYDANSSSDQDRPPDSTDQKMVRRTQVQALLEHGFDLSEITVYRMPKMRVPSLPRGTRLVDPPDTPGWGYCTDPHPIPRLPGPPAPGTNVILRYIPDGFIDLIEERYDGKISWPARP